LHHNADIVAELTMTLLLTAAKFIIPLDHQLRKNDWTARYEPNQSVFLMEKTVVILGYGAIGQRLTELCRAFGMTVVAVRRHRGPYIADADTDIPHELVGIDGLHEVLPRADVLLIALPQTSETEGLIGATELAMLPKPAILVNIGRGVIVDEQALYNALKDGTLYAGATDVWYNYPPDEASRTNTPPANFPFHELDNFVMSPHRAGASLDTEFYRMAYLAQALNLRAQGEPLPNKVDLEAGY
jgi:phosphoglycerate dehydrogenase-like enzyme